MKIEEIKILSNLYNELYNILNNRYDFIENINFDCSEDAVEVTYAQRVWGGEYDYVSYQIPFEYLVDEDSVRKFIDMEEEKKPEKKPSTTTVSPSLLTDFRGRLWSI